MKKKPEGRPEKPEKKPTRKKPSKRVTVSQAMNLFATFLPRIHSENRRVREEAAKTIRALAFGFARREGFADKMKAAEEFLGEEIPEPEKMAVSLYRISRNKEIQARLPTDLSQASQAELKYLNYMRDRIKIRSLRHLIRFIV